MQAVILAAGTGSRLRHMTESLPKALVQIASRPLLAYTVAFAQLVGCDDILVVAGAFGDDVIKTLEAFNLPKLRWVRNSDYLIGNLYSLGAARQEIHSDFILLNTDHVYHRDIALKVRSQCEQLVAFCDQDRDLGNDDMKVSLTKNGRLGSISKQLTTFDRGYVGMTYCPGKSLKSYFEAFDRVAEKFGDSAVVEMVLGELASSSNPPNVGDISGVGWLEIDTPEEHKQAQLTIESRPEDYAVVE